MNYQSFADLANQVRSNLHRIPRDVQLIVGIPRSGILPASMLALSLNVHYCDLNGLVTNAALTHGRTRKTSHPSIQRASEAKHILIIDDSINTGESIAEVRRKITALSIEAKVTYAAVYSTPSATQHVDIYFSVLNHPRIFEWNLMHRELLENCCLDIDGVLCLDPIEEENDDGPAYKQFLRHASPLALPSCTVGYLVSSRLEKYRPETEAWLSDHGVKYRELHLLDLPNAQVRRRLGVHGQFKARVYRKLSTTRLFVESESSQAAEIARLSGKHALCFSSQELFAPSILAASTYRLRHGLAARIIAKCRRTLKSSRHNDEQD